MVMIGTRALIRPGHGANKMKTDSGLTDSLTSGGSPILLVEDDDIDALAFRRTMANAHWKNEIVWVPSGICAVEKLAGKQDYAAVFTDLMLREMDGFAVIAWVKERFPNLPVIAISHRDDEESITKAFAAGADFYIPKPIRQVDLLNLVHNCSHRLTPATGAPAS